MTDAALLADDDETILRRLRALADGARVSAFARLSWEELATLALPPYWKLAWLERADDLIERAGALVRVEHDTVAIADPEDRELRDRLRDRPGALIPLAARLGHSLLARGALPPVIARWAELAARLSEQSPAAVAESILARVSDLCDASAAGQAIDLVDAAEVLGRVVTGPLTSAASIGRQRIRRTYRRDHDLRHLGSFVPRGEAIAAFEALCADRDAWALHYVGVGGAGKTSILRHIAAWLAPERGMPVARLDFDYLDPSYPAHDPGRLIAPLVRELQAEIATREHDRLIAILEEQLERVRQVSRSLPPSAPLAALAWPEVVELLSVFGSFLGSLGRPLLILDTCEELSKLNPIGGTIPSVEATLRILEELHDLAPGMRVIFAGRRLLTAGGAGWRPVRPPPGVALSAPRAYLRLCELRGFDEAETDALLAARLPEARRGDAALAARLRELSPEEGRVPGLAGDDPDPADRRYSPFQLALQLDFLAEQPDADVGRLGTGDIDPYTEQRIVLRMGDLEPILPAVALLRRFDTAALAIALGEDVAAVRAKIAALAGHEWIVADDLPGRGQVLTVKPIRGPRLERFLRDRRAVAWETARHRIAEGLARSIAEAPLARIPTEVFDAALRASPPDRAIALWSAVEQRIGSDWGWAYALCRALTGERAAAEDVTALLGAAVRATYASAVIHTQPRNDTAALWRDIAATALSHGHEEGSGAAPDPFVVRGLHPEPPERTVRERTDAWVARQAWLLARRAWLGRAAALAWHGDPAIDLGDLAAIVIEVCRELIQFQRLSAIETSAIAAIEALVERAERDVLAYRDELKDLSELFLDPEWEVAASGLNAFAAVLKIRIEALRGLGDRTINKYGWPSWTADWSLPVTCLDWAPPASLRDRVRLEVLRLFYLDEATSELLPAWCSEIGGEPHSIDADRLWSAIHLRLAAKAPIALSPPASFPTGDPERDHAVFRRFPPGEVTAALLTGKPLPPTTSLRDAVALQCRRARRLRDPALIPEGQFPSQFRSGVGLRIAVEWLSARAVIVGIDGIDMSLVAQDAITHWPYQSARTQARLEAVIAAVRPQVGRLLDQANTGSAMTRARAGAVLREVIELASFTRQPVAERVTELVPAPADVHPDLAEEAIRLRMRAWAFSRGTLDAGAAVPRWMAELALDEAALLSLRLPDNARKLFAWAREAFATSGDDEGRAAAERGHAAVSDQAFERGPRHRVPLLTALRAGLRRRWRAPVTALAVVTGAASGLVLLYGGWLLADRYVGPRIAPSLPEILRPHSTIAAMLLLLLVLWILSQSIDVLRILPGVYVRTVMELLMSGVEIRPDGEDMARVRFLGLDRKLVPKQARVRPGMWPVSADSRDHERAKQSSRSQRSILGALLPRLVPLPLDVSPVLTSHAWEALIFSADRRAHLIFDLFRTVPGHRGDRASRRAPVKIYAGPSLAANLEGRWAHTTGMIHAVGRPIRSLEGVRLDVSGGHTAAGRSAALAPSQLEVRGVPFVLLQGDPNGSSEVPSRAGRLEVSALRDFAVGLIEQGAESVLVIPALPQPTLQSIVEWLVEEFRDRSPHDRADRLAAARAIRGLLRDLPGSAHAEAAYEVTLFEVDGSVRS